MTRKRGFTLIELLVVIAIIALLIGLLLPALAKAQQNARSLKDKSQIRQVHTGMIIWANDNRDRLPTPGLVNREPAEINPGQFADVPGIGPEDFERNHSAPMYSLMVAQRLLPTKILIGSTEVNPNVVEYEAYDFDRYNPGNDEYWDPDFECDLTDNANSSYSHLAICGERKKRRWVNDSAGGTPVVGTRSPQFGTDANPDLLSQPQYVNSPTLQLHGAKEEWVGHVVFNDNHVETLNTFYAPLTNYEPLNSFVVQNDQMYACEFADAVSAVDPNEGSGDAWLVMTIGAGQEGDTVEDIYDPTN